MVIVTRRVDDRRSALIERCHNSCHSELFMGQRRNELISSGQLPISSDRVRGFGQTHSLQDIRKAVNICANDRRGPEPMRRSRAKSYRTTFEKDNRGFDLISRRSHPEALPTAIDVRIIDGRGRPEFGGIALIETKTRQLNS